MSDLLNARATSSVIMMYLAVPTVSDKNIITSMMLLHVLAIMRMLVVSVYSTALIYRAFGHDSVAVSISMQYRIILFIYFFFFTLWLILVLIIFCGLFINGPYALITTAVSNDLVREIYTASYTILSQWTPVMIMSCYIYTGHPQVPEGESASKGYGGCNHWWLWVTRWVMSLICYVIDNIC